MSKKRRTLPAEFKPILEAYEVLKRTARPNKHVLTADQSWMQLQGSWGSCLTKVEEKRFSDTDRRTLLGRLEAVKQSPALASCQGSGEILDALSRLEQALLKLEI